MRVPDKQGSEAVSISTVCPENMLTPDQLGRLVGGTKGGMCRAKIQCSGSAPLHLFTVFTVVAPTSSLHTSNVAFHLWAICASHG